MEQLGILVPIFMFVGLFTMLIFLRKYENDERMAMIEKGMDPGISRRNNGFRTLRLSLMFIGVGIGLLLGFIIQSSTEIANEGMITAIYFSTILIFGGSGLLLAYFINNRKNRQQ